jgi:hypothetical protein
VKNSIRHGVAFVPSVEAELSYGQCRRAWLSLRCRGIRPATGFPSVHRPRPDSAHADLGVGDRGAARRAKTIGRRGSGFERIGHVKASTLGRAAEGCVRARQHICSDGERCRQVDCVVPAQCLRFGELGCLGDQLALTAAVDGPYFPDWEIQILTAFERTELGVVLAAWPEAVVATPWTDDPIKSQFEAVSGVRNNLIGYPHGRWQELEATLGVSPQELVVLLQRWRGSDPHEYSYVEALE